MYQKFIINQDGVLRFGQVFLHRDLLRPGERCVYGGGLWRLDEGRRMVFLFGRSFDFGAPDFDYVRRIDWTGLGGKPISLYHMPNWLNEETLVPVFAKRQPEES